MSPMSHRPLQGFVDWLVLLCPQPCEQGRQIKRIHWVSNIGTALRFLEGRRVRHTTMANSHKYLTFSLGSHFPKPESQIPAIPDPTTPCVSRLPNVRFSQDLLQSTLSLTSHLTPLPTLIPHSPLHPCLVLADP